MAKFKDRFNCIVSVNGESHIYTNNIGKELILESAKRGFIKIREYKELQYEESSNNPIMGLTK